MDGQEDTPLPPSIAAAWGLRGRSGRGPKPGMTLERIVEAGVRVARAEGLAAVSMARVASELGASTMSLYRYVAAKEELLALMADAALGPPHPPEEAGESWRDGLKRWAWGCHERYREHPWVLQIPISGPPMTPNQVAWLDDGLRSLRDTGLAEHEKASVVLLLSGYVRNEAVLNADITAAHPPSEDLMAGYPQLLRAVTDPRDYPALHAVLDAGVFDVADDPDVEFVFGLERLLDGVEVLVNRARDGQRGGGQ